MYCNQIVMYMKFDYMSFFVVYMYLDSIYMNMKLNYMSSKAICM